LLAFLLRKFEGRVEKSKVERQRKKFNTEAQRAQRRKSGFLASLGMTLVGGRRKCVAMLGGITRAGASVSVWASAGVGTRALAMSGGFGFFQGFG
jgi:hypothetical protein